MGQLYLINKAIKILSMHQIDAYIVFHDTFRQCIEKPNIVQGFFYYDNYYLVVLNLVHCIHLRIGKFI